MFRENKSDGDTERFASYPCAGNEFPDSIYDAHRGDPSVLMVKKLLTMTMTTTMNL